MVWRETVLVELSLVLGNYPRFDSYAYEARPWAFVKHAENFFEEHVLGSLTPLRLAHTIEVIDRSIFFPLYV